MWESAGLAEGQSEFKYFYMGEIVLTVESYIRQNYGKKSVKRNIFNFGNDEVVFRLDHQQLQDLVEFTEASGKRFAAFEEDSLKKIS